MASGGGGGGGGGGGAGEEGAANDMIEFSLKDLYAIQMIQEERDVFHTLVNSLCPVGASFLSCCFHASGCS
jgi:hypothetical protein